MKTPLAIVLALAPPLVTAIVMGATDSLVVVIPYLLLTVVSGDRKIAGMLLILGVAVVLARILIVPQELYELWFQSNASLRSSIAISRIFVMVVTIPSAAIAASVSRHGGLPAIAATSLLILTVAGMALVNLWLLIAAIPVACITILLYGSGHIRTTRMLLLGAAVCILALPWLLTDEPAGNRFIDEVVSPGLRGVLVRRFPRLGLDLGVGMFNAQFDTRNLSGRVSLSERQVMEIEGRPGDVLYLRTGVFDVYTGNSWERSSRMQQAAETDGRDLFRDFPPRGNTITITFLSDLFEALPHTLTTRHVASADSPGRVAMRGQRDTGFRFVRPPLRGASVVLHEGLREAALAVRATGTYLQLPGDLPASVRELGEYIRREAGGDQQVAVDLILEHLSRGFRYTLDTSPGPRGTDFVEQFLFNTREGYCVQFATSFVVLARLSGIPTRYVTGFLVFMPDQDDDDTATVSRTVSGLSAHAWPEIWVANRGWTTVEPTPPMRTGAGSAADPLTERQLSELGLGPTETSDDLGDTAAADTDTPGVPQDIEPATPAESDDPRTRSPGALVWMALALIAVAGVPARTFVRHARARRLSPAAYADWCLGELVNASVGIGVASPREVGYREWGRQLAGLLSGCTRSVGRCVADAEHLYYGATAPSRASCRRILNLTRRCRRMRRHRLWRRVYGILVRTDA